MDLFRRKVRDERTGAEVAREYKSRINQFFESVAGRSLSTIPGEGDALERLCLWSQKAANDRVHFRKLHEEELKRRQKVEQQYDDLSSILAEKEGDIRELQSKIQSWKDHVRDINQQHERDIDASNQDHKLKVMQIEQKHDQELNELNTKHASKVDSLQRAYVQETNRLTGQLRMDEHTEKAWPDDVLKLRLQELQGLVKEVTQARNMRLNLPEDQQTLSFDPSRFLYRASKDKEHLLFKDSIWNILIEHFFSLPFGFGSLGRDARKDNDLFRAFAAWNSLFRKPSISDSFTDDDLLIFRSNTTANIWRAATFKSAFVNITQPNDEGDVHCNGTARLSKKNFDSTVLCIENLFHAAEPYMKSQTPVDLTKLRELVDLARKLAYQFGVNPDCLQLWKPRREEHLQISDAVHDYRNQGHGAGLPVMVEMVASPGLRKVAYDREGNPTSTLTIKACEILAAGSHK